MERNLQPLCYGKCHPDGRLTLQDSPDSIDLLLAAELDGDLWTIPGARYKLGG